MALRKILWMKKRKLKMAKIDYYYVWIRPEGATITCKPSALETYAEAYWRQEYATVWYKSPKKKTAKVV